MPRPATRTAILPADIADRILDAFGTQWVAWKQLNSAVDLEALGVTPSIFFRSLRGQTVSPDFASAITEAWNVRKAQPVEIGQ